MAYGLPNWLEHLPLDRQKKIARNIWLGFGSAFAVLTMVVVVAATRVDGDHNSAQAKKSKQQEIALDVDKICGEKKLSYSAFYNSPDDEYAAFQNNTAFLPQQKAMFALTVNGNYTISELLVRKLDNGNVYCKAKLEISGIYAGNSYRGTYWLNAF